MWWDVTLLKFQALGVLSKHGKEKVAKHLFVTFSCDRLVFKAIWANDTSARYGVPNYNLSCSSWYFVYFSRVFGSQLWTVLLVHTTRKCNTAFVEVKYSFNVPSILGQFQWGRLSKIDSSSLALIAKLRTNMYLIWKNMQFVSKGITELLAWKLHSVFQLHVRKPLNVFL